MNLTYHIILSRYFDRKPLYLDEPTQKKPNIRKLVEQPWQQTKGEMWDEVTETLCNLDFIQASAAAKKTFDLVKVINDVLLVIPDNAAIIHEENARQSRMEKYSRDLLLLYKKEITQIDIPESITPWTEEQKDAEIGRLRTHPDRADRLKDFKNFLGLEAENLQNYAHEFARFAIQQAWNYADEGPVGNCANAVLKGSDQSLILRAQCYRPRWNPLPQALDILDGHSGAIGAIAVTPDGKMAFTGSQYGTCIVWDLSTGEAIHTVTGHNAMISVVAITPDGRRGVSGSGDCTCILWNLVTGAVIRTFTGFISSVSTLAISPDGQQVITGNWNTCIVWDCNTGNAVQTSCPFPYKDVRAVSYTTRGIMAVSFDYNGNGAVWDPLTNGILRTFEWLDCPKSISVTPDEKLAITGSSGGTCTLRDLATGEPIHTFSVDNFNITSFSITPDGKRAVSNQKNSYVLWDLTKAEAVQTYKMNSTGYPAMSITPDGTRAILAAERSTFSLVDLIKGKNYEADIDQSPLATKFVLTPDRKKVIIWLRDKTCILWDLETQVTLHKLDDINQNIISFAFTPGGGKAIINSWKSFLLWDLTTGEVVKSPEGHDRYPIETLFLTPDGNRVVTWSVDRGCLLWDFHTKQVIKTIKEPSFTGGYWWGNITPDGRLMVTGTNDHTCRIWDLDTGSIIKTFEGHQNIVSALSITPDGKRVFSSSIDDNICLLWDLNTGKVNTVFADNDSILFSIPITPDGKRAITASHDGSSFIWNLRTGKGEHILPESGPYNKIVSISPDGKRMITQSSERSIIQWDLPSYKKLSVFSANSLIIGAAFVPGGILMGTWSEQTIFFNADKKLIFPDIAIVTIRRIWDFNQKKYKEPSADCPLCGSRFSPLPEVVQTIKKITRRSGLKPWQSPCIDLPDEYWEDPGLVSVCPDCGEPLKFNPFIAGIYKPKPRWKFWEK